MKIAADRCILHGLYEYDIPSCSYNILRSVGMEPHLISDSKEERLIKIGLLQRNNPILNRFVVDTTGRIIDSYKKEYNLDIIVRQFDGIITKNKILNVNNIFPIKYNGYIKTLLIDPNRTSYISIRSFSVIVKGVKNKPIDISFYNLLQNINFDSSKNELIAKLEYLKRAIIHNSKLSWHIFSDNGSLYFHDKDNQKIVIPDSMLKYITINDIDTYHLWDYYIWPFIESAI